MNILLCNGLILAGAQELEEDTDRKESKLLVDRQVDEGDQTHKTTWQIVLIAIFH
jgi:hypothetical protein